MDFHTRLTLDSDPEPNEAAARLRSALDQSRVVHVIGGPTGPTVLEPWQLILNTLGTVDNRGENPLTNERFDAVWSDVRYIPNHASNSYRHSNTTQPFHTDGSYNANPPNVDFFYCDTAADSGGETTFLDGPDLIESLRNDDPDLLKLLMSTPVSFQKGQSPGQVVPIIKEDEFGILLDWNENRVIPGQGKLVDSITESFARYVRERFSSFPPVMPIRLNPGEAVIFHERRVLHGRRAFIGDRCLWTLHMYFQHSKQLIRSFPISGAR
jgi:hypothetical protein